MWIHCCLSTCCPFCSLCWWGLVSLLMQCQWCIRRLISIFCIWSSVLLEASNISLIPVMNLFLFKMSMVYMLSLLTHPYLHELHAKIHDILDNAVSKQVKDTCHVLVYILFPGSVLRSGLKISPFFTILRNTTGPSEASFYGHINWSLAQAEQKSSLNLSQASTWIMGV